MPNSANRINNDIEENKPLTGENAESFDEDAYGKNISELSKEKVLQKKEDNIKVEELKNYLLDKESLSDDRKRIITEILGGEDVDAYDLELSREELENINNNKDLISEITGNTWFLTEDLYYYGKGLAESTREELENINNNKDLISEITGEQYLAFGNLIEDGKNLSKLTRNELENINNNKKLILEITGKDKIDISDLTPSLGGLTKEELENINNNKDLILEITGKEKIDISDLKELSDNIEEIVEISKKYKKTLIFSITGDEDDENVDEIALTIEELENINNNKKLILEITGKDKIDISDLTPSLGGLTKEELENINNNKDLILEITGNAWFFTIYLSYCGKNLCKLTREELENIKNNKDLILEITGKDKIDISDLTPSLGELTENDLQNIKRICDKNKKGNQKYDISAIIKMDDVIKNSNITTIKNYVKRKQDYLEKNELINDSEFKELFGFKITKDGKKITGKFGKGDIFQTDLGYCYLYTAYEILKKMNFFEVLIRTNLKKSENGDGWYVRLPMGQLNGEQIHIHKDEIDKTFDILDNDGEIREGVSINSNSMLGFKIMEIAYIKKSLINHDDDSRKEFLGTGDISLTGEKLAFLEGGSIYKALKILLGDNYIVQWFSREVDKDMVFNNFKQGLMVELGVKEDGINDEIEVHRYGKASIQALGKDVKMISNDKDIKIIQSGFTKNNDGTFELITNRSKEMLSDVVDNNGVLQAVFYKEHSYSLERCYIDKSTGEKRVWVVNPWHTGIKFDISLESAKKIFDWDVAYIDFDKLFR